MEKFHQVAQFFCWFLVRFLLFGEEMLNNHVHANTLLAMGVLIQNLDALRGEARKDFTAKFATFKHEENQSAFKSLLAAKD